MIGRLVKSILLAIFIAIVLLCLWITFYRSDWMVVGRPKIHNWAVYPNGCPAGTDEIGHDDSGSLICKQQPTGCPYGDNIPVDSIKCAPDKDSVYNANQPAMVEFVGK